MSSLQEKLERPLESDNVTRARLYDHLAFRGYLIVEEDKIGPVKVLVDGMMELQTWERDAKLKGDFQMKLVASRPWMFDKPKKKG